MVAGTALLFPAACGDVRGSESGLDDCAAEVAGFWDPVSGLAVARRGHAVVVLEDGNVMVVGGHRNEGFDREVLDSVEVLDPAMNTVGAAASLPSPLTGANATRLPSGRVLVSGGRTAMDEDAGVFRYEPASDSWAALGTMPDGERARRMLALTGGEVLIWTASHNEARVFLSVDEGETWDEQLEIPAWSRVDDTLPLVDGRGVLLAGGNFSIYDPQEGSWGTTTIDCGWHAFNPRDAAAAQLDGESLLVLGSQPVYCDDCQGSRRPFAARVSLEDGACELKGFTPCEDLLYSGDLHAAAWRVGEGEVVLTVQGRQRLFTEAAGWADIEAAETAAMSFDRFANTAVLPDGRLIVVGGASLNAEIVNGVEIWSP